MAFKMKNAGGTFKSMGSSAMKTRRPSQKPPQGEDLIAGDKNFTKKEQKEKTDYARETGDDLFWDKYFNKNSYLKPRKQKGFLTKC